ncbi:hypothetical protein L2734_10955 [Parashewanella spongiae]|uniref:hypothetical protein n=1 Tax=Parashewanella spongiae TaxID=342950 RepID=UPI0015D19659|nr:hypothetical protein [Parashewanella spongiae]MCL1078669.1 hypothetical protein [Parashewanella spongiae]
MRKITSHYLGVHTDCKIKIISHIIGHNSIALKQVFSAKGSHSDGSEFSYRKKVLDVIELENGQVSAIRRYGK